MNVPFDNHPIGAAGGSEPVKRLTRPRDERMVAGVCSGVARYLSVDPALVRLLFVVSFLLPGPQILIYLAGWILVPEA